MNSPGQQATGGVRRAGRREWTGLAVLALAAVLYSMDLTVLYLAIPAISQDLRPSSAQLLWITDIYGFLVAGCLVTMGTLGDRIGRRRLLLMGAAAFAVISVAAAFATSPPVLICARALLGVAGATLAPSALSLLFRRIRRLTQPVGRAGPPRSAWHRGRHRAVPPTVVGGGAVRPAVRPDCHCLTLRSKLRDGDATGERN